MLKLYTLHRFQVPAGAISESGVRAIEQFISSQNLQSDEWKALNPDNARMLLPYLPEDWQWDWLVSGRGEYVGTFPKRVGKFFYKEYALKCPQSFLMQIGNMAKVHSESEELYIFEFVDNFDWEAGDFGDRGSCYWGSYAGARVMLRENGGMAIRFYNNDQRGIGRAWLVEIDSDLYILFNGYGLSTLNIARIFSLFVGLQYKRIKVDNSYGGLYVNGNTGYIIGRIEVIDEIDEHDFEWSEVSYESCSNCGRAIDEDETYYGADDMPYCDNCHSELFRSCYHCGETFNYDDVTYVESVEDDVCEYCLDRHFTECSRCKEYFYPRNMERFGEHLCCHECSNELRIEGDNIE